MSPRAAKWLYIFYNNLNLLYKIFFTCYYFFCRHQCCCTNFKRFAFFGWRCRLFSSDYKSNNPSDHSFYPKYSSFNLSPSFACVVRDNVVLGVRLVFSSYNYDYNQNPPLIHNNVNNIGASIYVRKYLPLVKAFFVFADASLGGQSNYRKDLNNGIPDYFHTVKGYSISAMIYPGVSYQVTKCLFLEMALNNLVTLGYTRTNTEQQGRMYQTTKG